MSTATDPTLFTLIGNGQFVDSEIKRSVIEATKLVVSETVSITGQIISPLNMGGQPLQNLGPPQGPTDAITAGGVATIVQTVVQETPLTSISLSATGTGIQTNGAPISGLPATPAAADDAVSQTYVDNKVAAAAASASGGVKLPVRVATTTGLPTHTSPSVQVLQGSVVGVLPAIDGVTLAVGDRLLVRQESPSSANGLYVVTSVGSGSTAWVLTRSADMNTMSGFLYGSQTNVIVGTTLQRTAWMLDSVVTVIGTSSVVFVQLFVGGGGGSTTTQTSLIPETNFVYRPADSPVTLPLAAWSIALVPTGAGPVDTTLAAGSPGQLMSVSNQGTTGIATVTPNAMLTTSGATAQVGSYFQLSAGASVILTYSGERSAWMNATVGAVPLP